VGFLQGQLAVVFLLILVLVAIVAVVLFFGLFRVSLEKLSDGTQTVPVVTERNKKSAANRMTKSGGISIGSSFLQGLRSSRYR
jgi:cell division protein YceG involved in septum cleavage